MTSSNSPYNQIKTRKTKQSLETKTRYRIPFLALVFGFIFIVLSTITIFKNFHHKDSIYNLDKTTCLSNLNLKFLDQNVICNQLVGKLNFSDFKLQDTQTFELTSTSKDHLVAKIELPVTDFYSSLTNLTTDQFTDQNFLKENQINYEIFESEPGDGVMLIHNLSIK